MSDNLKEREAFEAWYEAYCMPGESDWFRRDVSEPDEYHHTCTSEAWAGWNARAAVEASRAAVPAGFVTDLGFRWDCEKQHHVPQLVIEFEPVPANSPCGAKGWADRDRAAKLFSTAPQPVAQPGEPIAYTPGEWFDATTVDLMQAFYESRLPAIREAAKEHGYAIGLHGSMRRDLDLIAAPWRDGASDPDTLAHAIAVAACGITRAGTHDWEQKPAGRVATCLPICWTHRHGVLSDGHIDLSVATVTQAKPEQAAHPRDQIGADRLAAAVARLVSNRGIDARSEAADALLDYLDVGGVGGPSDVPAWLAQYEKRQAAASPKPKD